MTIMRLMNGGKFELINVSMIETITFDVPSDAASGISVVFVSGRFVFYEGEQANMIVEAFLRISSEP